MARDRVKKRKRERKKEAGGEKEKEKMRDKLEKAIEETRVFQAYMLCWASTSEEYDGGDVSLNI